MDQRILVALFIFPALVVTQSGSEDDEPPAVTCISRLRMSNVVLTCDLEEDGDVTNITLCTVKTEDCRTATLTENLVTFKHLNVLLTYGLELQYRSKEKLTKTYDLKKIIKPDPPRVNANFFTESWTAVITIDSTYYKDYLTDNLEFEVMLTYMCDTEGKKYNIQQNDLHIESGDTLRENRTYHVKARSKPKGTYFEGTWSEWSNCPHFHTSNKNRSHDHQKAGDHLNVSLCIYLVVGALIVVVLAFAVVVVLRSYKKIKSVIWPIIPNPKHTQVQGYKPNKGPPVSFNPDAFNDSNIHLIDQVEDKHASPDVAEVPGGREAWAQSSGHMSADPVLRRGTCTEEESQPVLQTGIRGGQGSSSGCRHGSPLGSRSGGNGGEGNNGAKSMPLPQRCEPYVTMSSFHRTQ